MSREPEAGSFYGLSAELGQPHRDRVDRGGGLAPVPSKLFTITTNARLFRRAS